MQRFLIGVLVVFLLLLAFSYINAIVFPVLPTTTASVTTFGSDLLLLIVPVLLTAVIGYYLGKGIRGVKNPLEGFVLSYVSAFLVGGVLALLTVLNFSFSAHVNLGWLGGTWYDQLFTIFLIGAPIMLIYLA
ncbi:MAG TPA: hypothetical protein VKV40_22910 [Ktedonobacteraceae bacterium]|nr:hypothetical protein [Ktedonobacteraceae bacterium]